MTVKQFQELYFIAQSKDHDLDKSIKMVGVMTGKIPDEVEKMPLKRFNKLCARISMAFSIIGSKLNTGKPKSIVRVGTRFYKIHYRVDRKPINAGRYVDVITFGKDVIGNLHKIMASISEPVKLTVRGFVPYNRSHEDMAADFERMDFEAAYQAAVFFCTLYRVSMQIIQPSLVKELASKGIPERKAKEMLNASLLILDGCITPKWSQNMREYLLNRYGQ